MDIKWLSSASDRKERCEQPLGCWDLESLPGAHSVLKYSKPPGHVLLVRPQVQHHFPQSQQHHSRGLMRLQDGRLRRQATGMKERELQFCLPASQHQAIKNGPARLPYNEIDS